MSNSVPTSHPFCYIFPDSVSYLESDSTAAHWEKDGNPFNTVHPIATNDALSTIRFQPGALAPYECRQVMTMGELLPRSDGRMDGSKEANPISHMAWIEPNAENHWLYHKLGILFVQAAEHFNFELTGLIDALQYIRCEEDQYFDWRSDIGTGTSSTRKLSMTIQLSADDEYVGGELQFMNAPSGKGQGAAIVFPSYMVHRVNPVVLGVRCSLLAWGCGPAFR